MQPDLKEEYTLSPDSGVTTLPADKITKQESAEAMFKRLTSRLISNYLLMNLTEESNFPVRDFLGSLERELIIATLRVAQNNQRITAKVLGLKETTLCEKMRKYQIKRDKFNPILKEAENQFHEMSSLLIS